MGGIKGEVIVGELYKTIFGCAYGMEENAGRQYVWQRVSHAAEERSREKQQGEMTAAVKVAFLF